MGFVEKAPGMQNRCGGMKEASSAPNESISSAAFGRCQLSWIASLFVLATPHGLSGSRPGEVMQKACLTSPKLEPDIPCTKTINKAM